MRKKNNSCKLQIVLLTAVLAALAFYYWRDELRDWTVDDTLYSAEIAAAARQNGLDPLLVRAVIFQESRFQADCCGSKGEVGLMQVMPGKTGAAADYARLHHCKAYSRAELFEVGNNLRTGCWYLARALRKFAGRPDAVELALCQYNAGPARALKWAAPDGDKPVDQRITIASTRRYVRRIMARYRKYQKMQPGKGR